MKAKPHYKPAGYHTATPYLIAAGAARALDFYQQAFGATELMRMPMPDGRLGHAEFIIDESHFMLADENPQWNARGPKTLGGTPVGLLLYVPDCDATFNRAVSLGATVMMPLKDQFYGDRSGTVIDPFGHQWTIATHVEDVSKAELDKGAAEMFKQMTAQCAPAKSTPTPK